MHFRRLEVYRLAIELVPLSNQLASALGRGAGDLRAQLRRASMSIPLNIAEAVGRTGKADQRRHFAIARGSAMECAAIADVCRVLGRGDAQTLEPIDTLLESVVRMLSKLCRG